MKEKCLFCDELLEVERKNLIVYFDCLDHGWYSVSEPLRHNADLRTWTLSSTQALVPLILSHNRQTGRAFQIPDHWVGRKVKLHIRDNGTHDSTLES